VNVIWIVGSAFAYDCLRGLRAAHPGLRVADLLFNSVGHTANNRRRRDLIDLIFVENNEVHDWLVARGEDGSRLRLVKSGVDLAALHPMTRSRAFEQQIGAAPTDLIVGFSGRWSLEKNPVGFVEIARLVDPALPVRFIVTGTGNLRSAIEHAVQEACFPEGRFHLLGEISEFAPVLASFDLLVVPSLLDGRPVVVLEALSMGVPVVASRVGALPELVQDSKAGWLCEPGDSREFAKCIERAARDRTGLFDMRRREREYAEYALDIRAMLVSYEKGLASLLPEKPSNA
jgi:glycosyltransferase involved in cell wall biosynthesis